MIPGNKGTCPFFERECVDKECEKCDKYDISDKPNRIKGVFRIIKSPEKTEGAKIWLKSWLIFGIVAFVLFIIAPIFLMNVYISWAMA